MPRIWKGAVNLCVVALGCVAGQSHALEPCMQMAPTFVSLSGRVYLESKYGPPGFGETPKRDLRLTSAILKLDHTIYVCSDSNSSSTPGKEPVREVQLDFNQHEPISRILRNEVTVTGLLSEGLTASDFRRIRMLVARLRVPDDLGRSVVIYRDTTGAMNATHRLKR
jgi:hypothetical protein